MNPLLPSPLDNGYRGHPAALWLIFWMLPIARIGTKSAPGFYINLAIVAVMVVGVVLALRVRPRSAPA